MRYFLAIAVILAAAASLAAAPLTVSSYSMQNGAVGSFNYRDFTYVPCNGVCNTTSAALSGGTGKLTNGISPALDWYQEGPNTSWVGWDTNQGLLNPVVTFLFPGVVTVDTVTVWASNSRSGGVALPSSIVIGGIANPVAADLGNTSPRALVFSGINLSGNSLTVEFDQASGFSWAIIGEVSFDGRQSSAIPEPGTWLLIGTALPLLVALRRRRPALSSN